VVVTLNTLTSELSDNSELFAMSKEEGDDAGLLTIEVEGNKLSSIVEQLESSTFRQAQGAPKLAIGPACSCGST